MRDSEMESYGVHNPVLEVRIFLSPPRWISSMVECWSHTSTVSSSNLEFTSNSFCENYLRWTKHLGIMFRLWSGGSEFNSRRSHHTIWRVGRVWFIAPHLKCDGPLKRIREFKSLTLLHIDCYKRWLVPLVNCPREHESSHFRFMRTSIDRAVF